MEECQNETVSIEQLNAQFPHLCYILKSAKHLSNYTYNGYTVNIQRRIRQHNGEITGGARTTKAKRPWEYIMIIASSDEAFNKNRALSLEWHLRYPTNKRPRPKEFQGPVGRILGVDKALANFQHDYPFVMAVKKEYYEEACKLESVQNKHISLYILE